MPESQFKIAVCLALIVALMYQSEQVQVTPHGILGSTHIEGLPCLSILLRYYASFPSERRTGQAGEMSLPCAGDLEIWQEEVGQTGACHMASQQLSGL